MRIDHETNVTLTNKLCQSLPIITHSSKTYKTRSIYLLFKLKQWLSEVRITIIGPLGRYYISSRPMGLCQ